MSLRPQRREMVEVDLVEDDSAPLPPVQGPSTVGSARSGRPGPPDADPVDTLPDEPAVHVVRARRSRLGPAVALLAAVVVVTLATDDRPVPAVGAFPGGAPTLASPMAEAWRVPAGNGWSVDGDLLITTTESTAGLTVHGHDLGTGTELWSSDLPPEIRGVVCPGGAAGPDGRVVVCRVVEQVAQIHHFPDGAKAEPGSLLVLAASDGKAVSLTPFAPGHVALATVADQVLVAHMEQVRRARGRTPAQMSLHIELRDLRSGRRVWERRLPVDGYRSPEAVHVSSEAGLVVVTGATTAVLDAADGSQLLPPSLGGDGSADLQPDVVTVTHQGFGVARDVPARTAWFGRDGSPLVTLAGEVSEPVVGDDSEPGILLTTTAGREPALRAVDLQGGNPMWSTRLLGGRPVVRLAGAVVISGEGVLRSVDLRTGQELWRSPIRGLDDAQAVSDGTFVLATGETGPGVQTIVAVSLKDGSLLWRSPLPPGVTSLAVLSGRVVGLGPAVVVGMG